MKTIKLISVSLLTLAAALPGVSMAGSMGDSTSHVSIPQPKQPTLHRDAVLMALEAAMANRTFNTTAGDATATQSADPVSNAKRDMTKAFHGSYQHMGDAT